MNLKGIINNVVEVNAKLIGDAAFTKLGYEAHKMLLRPTAGKLPKELEALAESPAGKLLIALGFDVAAGNYSIEGIEPISNALTAAAMDACVNGLVDGIKERIVTRHTELVGSAGVAALPPAVVTEVANTAKGGTVVVGPIVAKAAKVVSSVFAGPAGGSVDPRYAAKANTATGGEVVVEVEVAKKYWPVTKEELEKNPKTNLCKCPNPLGKEDHEKQRDKFTPWTAPNGYREDLKGLMICGGCRDFLVAEYHKEKKQQEAADKAAKALAAASEKLELLNQEYIELQSKHEKAEATRKSFFNLVEADPQNDDLVSALASQEKKVLALKDQITSTEAKMLELEELLNPSPTKEDVPPATPAANNAKGGENMTQANAKVPSSALAKIKNKHNHKK